MRVCTEREQVGNREMPKSKVAMVAVEREVAMVVAEWNYGGGCQPQDR